jgi:hypothetical protein
MEGKKKKTNSAFLSQPSSIGIVNAVKYKAKSRERILPL